MHELHPLSSFNIELFRVRVSERVSILQGIDSKSTHEVSEKRVRGARR